MLQQHTHTHTHTNTHTPHSVMGLVDRYTDEGAVGPQELVREVPTAYDCGVDGCGGGIYPNDSDTVFNWRFGICVSQGVCESVKYHCYMTLMNAV